LEAISGGGAVNYAPRMFEATQALGADRRVRLLGQPHLHEYIAFVKEKTVGGERADVRALADEWRAANDHFYELEQSEAGLADEVQSEPIGPSLRPLADALEATPRFKAAFDALPTTIERVELDRLVVCQQSVSLGFAADLQARLSSEPDDEELFRFCLPMSPSVAPVEVTRLDEYRYLFTSDSSDFRPHEPTLLRPGEATGLPSHDPVGAVLGLPVGFGSNFLQAVRVDGRLILHNGYHRAYALRAHGLTHAICVLQEVTRRDELKLIGADAVVDAPEFYCRAARPPLFKDFFDPKVSKILDVRRMRRVIEVKLDVREFQIVD